MSTGLYTTYTVTQEQQAMSDGALMTDAAQGWELIRQMDRTQRICAWCGSLMGTVEGNGPATHGICQSCRDRNFPKPGKAQMPADFAGALEDVANGASYCADGIDWEYTEEREPWGD